VGIYLPSHEKHNKPAVAAKLLGHISVFNFAQFPQFEPLCKDSLKL